MRSIVKHSYIRRADAGQARAIAHVRYIQFRPGRDAHTDSRCFFNGKEDNIPSKEVKEAIKNQNKSGVVVHKLILSPGVADADVRDYTRDIMSRLSSRKGLDFEWYGVRHDNTDNPHCHVVLMATSKGGRQVRLKKEDHLYITELWQKI